MSVRDFVKAVRKARSRPEKARAGDELLVLRVCTTHPWDILALSVNMLSPSLSDVPFRDSNQKKYSRKLRVILVDDGILDDKKVQAQIRFRSDDGVGKNTAGVPTREVEVELFQSQDSEAWTVGSFGVGSREAPYKALWGRTPQELSRLIRAKSAVVMDADTRQILFGVRTHARLRPASLTKIMTLYIILAIVKKCPSVMEEDVQVSLRAAAPAPGSTAELGYQDTIKVRHLLFGLMLPSGNDAAVALAEHFGERLKQMNLFDPNASDSPAKVRAPFRRTGSSIGRKGLKARGDSGKSHSDSLDLFILEMNRCCDWLGLSDTRFVNPHGAMGASKETRIGHYTTAAEMALLTVRAVEDPIFRKIVGTVKYRCTKAVFDASAEGHRTNKTSTWVNTHRLLGVDGVSGVKTGVTHDFKTSLSTHARQKDGSLVVVTLESELASEAYEDHKRLLSWGWNAKQEMEDNV